MMTYYVLLSFFGVVVGALFVFFWRRLREVGSSHADPPLFCPKCNATWRRADPRCWNCRTSASNARQQAERNGSVLAEIDYSAVLKLSVLPPDRLLLNGIEANLAELDRRPAQLKLQRGIVWYYRAGTASDHLPPLAEAVLQRVAKHGLPISLSTLPDFSDSVWEDGVVRPRNQ